MLSSAQHVSTGSPWGQRSKRSNLLFFPPLPESCARDLPPPEKVPALNTPGEKGWGTWRLSTGPPSPRGFSSSFLCQSHQAGEPVLPETPLGAAVPRARRLDMAFARWGGASWEQDLSWGHGETLVRPGCLRSSSALLHLSPKTRGGGRLLCWPPRQSAHLGCSAATARLCWQVGS